MKDTLSTYSALILAGGSSERMGFPKPWLCYKADTTYLQQIVSLYCQIGIRRIVVVLNNDFSKAPWLNNLYQIEGAAQVVRNHHPDKGRLYSVFLGVQEITTDKILIHNVDNPFVEASVMDSLIRQAGNEDVTIPWHEGKKGHPVIISAEVRNHILRAYQEFTSLKEILDQFRREYVEVNTTSIFQNINTPVDYQTTHGYL